jgi:SNF family Na+-dependent transporter
MQSGKVPMFKMQPHHGTLWLAIVVFFLGLAFFLDTHLDPADIPAHRQGKFVFALSIVVAGLLMIISTGRMWFKHLWHDRYGRR